MRVQQFVYFSYNTYTNSFHQFVSSFFSRPGKWCEKIQIIVCLQTRCVNDISQCILYIRSSVILYALKCHLVIRIGNVWKKRDERRTEIILSLLYIRFVMEMLECQTYNTEHFEYYGIQSIQFGLANKWFWFAWVVAC